MTREKKNEKGKPVDVAAFEVDPKFNPPVAGAGVDAAAVFPKENVPVLGGADVAAGMDPVLKLEALKAEDQFRGLNITHTTPPSIHVIILCFDFSFLGSLSTPVQNIKEKLRPTNSSSWRWPPKLYHWSITELRPTLTLTLTLLLRFHVLGS